MLSTGLAGVAIGAVLLLWGGWRRSLPLATTGGAYLLASCFVLCLRGALEHMHQVKKKRYSQ